MGRRSRIGSNLLALFGVFLDVGVKLGVNPALLAFQLLFAANYFSMITQGSSANCCLRAAAISPRVNSIDWARSRPASASWSISSSAPWLFVVAR